MLSFSAEKGPSISFKSFVRADLLALQKWQHRIRFNNNNALQNRLYEVERKDALECQGPVNVRIQFIPFINDIRNKRVLEIFRFARNRIGRFINSQ